MYEDERNEIYICEAFYPERDMHGIRNLVPSKNLVSNACEPVSNYTGTLACLGACMSSLGMLMTSRTVPVPQIGEVGVMTSSTST